MYFQLLGFSIEIKDIKVTNLGTAKRLKGEGRE